VVIKSGRQQGNFDNILTREASRETTASAEVAVMLV
jgi:hypothetical protein